MKNHLMLAALFALLSSAPAIAQDAPGAFDSRWSPYVGCWSVVQDQYGRSAPAGTTVCVRPTGRSGVTITTTVDGKSVLEQTIVADGSAQPISQADCTGTQTSNWSRDGERLFTNVELACANRPKRSVSGITLMVNGRWVDAQATVIDGSSDVRVQRYRRAGDQRAGIAPISTAPMSIEDVIEASAKVQSEALEAALVEANTRYALNSRVLKQLADNGVSRNVIDLMVAQTYPDRFQVDRAGYPASAPASYGTSTMGSSSVFLGSTMYPSPMYDPFYSNYYYYSPFAYPYYWGANYIYGYGSPFYRNYYNYNNYYGFGGGGYYGGGYYGGGGSLPSGGNAQPGSPDSRGGDGVATSRGYTRVRPAGSTGSGDSATPSSRSGGSIRGSSASDSSSSSSPSSSSSGSSSSSSGGYSGGGGDSGGGGGRTAQPR